MEASLRRGYSTDEGTFGVVTLSNGASFRTGELPYRGNAQGISSVPAGTYTCLWQYSSRHGMCYHLTGVEGRSDVEIHAANFMGDVALGWESQLRGCIAIGLDVGRFANSSGKQQVAVLHSREGLAEFNALFAGTPFQLIIRDAL